MSKLMRRVAMVGGITGLSRLGGLVREQLMAYLFGTGLAKSAFDVAFRIPNLLRRLFGEGALSAAFIPVYTEVYERDGPEEANLLASKMAGLLVASLSILTAAGILLAVVLQRYLAVDSRWAAILPLLRIMLVYGPLICLAALAMGVLNALKHFAIPALAPVFLNIVWIIALLAICPFIADDPFARIQVIAWAVVLAGIIQVAVQLPVLRRYGVLLRLSLHWRGDQRIARILRLMAPMAIGAGLIQINVCIDGILAMWSAEWAPSALEYAERLVYLPLGLVGNAFATVLLPTLSTQAATADNTAMAATFNRSLRNTIVIMAPAAVGLYLLALPLVNLIYRFGQGAFDAESAIHTARALQGYAPGLLVFSIYKVLTPLYYAQQDTATPVKVGMFCVGLNFAMNIMAIILLPHGWKHVGIAASTVIASLVNCLWLLAIIQHRQRLADLKSLVDCLSGALVAAAAMGLIVVLIHTRALDRLAGQMTMKLAQILAMGLTVTVAAVVYLLVGLLSNRSGMVELHNDLQARPEV